MSDEEVTPQSLDANRVKTPQQLEQAPETTEDIGEAAVGETATQIPVKGPEGDTDPATQQWREENWEADKEKAHTMALAGDEMRTEAADKRSAAKFTEEFKGPVEEFSEAIEEHPGFGQDEKNLVDFDVAKARWAKAEEKEEFVLPKYAKSERIAEHLRKYAEYADEKAASIEEWAATLHEHPISEEYIQTHPGIDFDAKCLRLLEIRAEGKLEAAEQLKEKGKLLRGTSIYRGIDYSDLPHYADLQRRFRPNVQYPSLGVGELMQTVAMERIFASKDTMEKGELDEETAKIRSELRELDKNPETKLGQLTQFYCKLLEEAYINPLRNDANTTKALLEDIRSGRAGKPPELTEKAA